MLRSVKKLGGYAIQATDGECGRVSEILFDDEKWVVRYLVVNTGGWLRRKQVLVSPLAVREIAWEGQRIHLNLSREQIEKSPDIQTDKPVSRQMEARYFNYYQWPYYWTGPSLWGSIGQPGAYAATPPVDLPPGMQASDADRNPPELEAGDIHLRSTKEVTGYHIQAQDDTFGHVEDFILDDSDWAIRYLVIDTRNWWPGRSVLVSPQWVTHIDWAERKVHVDMPRESIQNSPEYDPEQLNREYEEKLYDHYGYLHLRYWMDRKTPGRVHEHVHSEPHRPEPRR